jgi:hypothetical protein
MKKFAILSLMAVLALGACDDDDDPTGNTGTAQVRVVNATTGTTYASANVFRSNNGTNQIVAGVGQGAASACGTTYTVPAGTQTLSFRAAAGTTNATTTTFNFQANQRYTIVLYGTNTDPHIAVLQDEATQTNATAGNRRFRFVNASTNTTTAADIFARANTTGNPTAGTATVAAVASGQAGSSGGSTYVNVPTANTFFQIYNTGNVTTPRYAAYSLVTTNFPTSGNATLFFTDVGAFQINNCS